MSAVFTISVTVGVKNQLGALAAATGRSKSKIVLDAVKRYIELESWPISEIQAAIREANAGDFASQIEVDDLKRRWSSNAV